MPAAHVEPGRNVDLHRKQDAIKNPLLLFERWVEKVCVNRACTEHRTMESCYMRAHTAAPGQLIPCHHNRWNYCAECVRIGLMRGKCPRSELAPCGNVTVEPPLSDAAAERCADHIYNYTKGHYPFLPSIWARYHADAGPAPLEALLAAGANVGVGSSFPRIIHQTWKTKEVPLPLRAFHATWLARNPGWTHWVWNDAENRALIAEHYAWMLPYYDELNMPVKKADAVRFAYMHRYGGIYADLDAISVRPLAPLFAAHEATADVLLGQLHKPSGESIPNAVMASKPGATFWLHVMREFVRRVNCHKPEFDTGPALITYVANSLGAAHRVTVLPAAAFYPIDWLTGRGGLNCRSERENATLVEEVVRRVADDCGWVKFTQLAVYCRPSRTLKRPPRAQASRDCPGLPPQHAPARLSAVSTSRLCHTPLHRTSGPRSAGVLSAFPPDRQT